MRFLIWDFDNTLAHRPGLWSQCLADVANENTFSKSYSREQFVPYLASGFPWHTPELSHHELSSPEAWWSKMYLVFSKAFKAVSNFRPELAQAAAYQVREKYLDPQGWHVYPDVFSALARLSDAGWNHIILSNHWSCLNSTYTRFMQLVISIRPC
jgi:putative hydrolase of the HAD superfamily